jgi:DNA topoisomerase-1
MEDQLDAISRGEEEHLHYLQQFYFGNGHPGLKQQLLNKVDEIDARDVSRIAVATPAHGEPIFVRVGRYGPFLEQGERRASLPDKMAPDELTLATILEMLDKAEQTEEPLGICPETHKPVFIKIGRFGPYVQRGTAEDDDKPQNASLLKGMKPEEMDLATALALLSLPRTLGNHPQSGLPIAAFNGRYGPYVRVGEETRSLAADMSPLTITMEQALDLLSRPKPGRGAASRAPLKVFDISPVTQQPVELKEGRYGPYVTDGQTNASLPRNSKAEEVTFPMALELLKARAEKLAADGGAPRRSAARRSAPRKAAVPKKATAKKKPASGVKAKRAVKKKSAG